MKFRDKLTNFYLKNIKKQMFCPACTGKLRINRKKTVWECDTCDYSITTAEFEDDYVFWFCDDCGAFLNNQAGFNRRNRKHKCVRCGFVNDTTPDNIKGICKDCGVLLDDPDATQCHECWEAEKARLEAVRDVCSATSDLCFTLADTVDSVDRLRRGDYSSESESTGITLFCDNCGNMQTSSPYSADCYCSVCGKKLL